MCSYIWLAIVYIYFDLNSDRISKVKYRLARARSHVHQIFGGGGRKSGVGGSFTPKSASPDLTSPNFDWPRGKIPTPTLDFLPLLLRVVTSVYPRVRAIQNGRENVSFDPLQKNFDNSITSARAYKVQSGQRSNMSDADWFHSPAIIIMAFTDSIACDTDEARTRMHFASIDTSKYFILVEIEQFYL